MIAGGVQDTLRRGFSPVLTRAELVTPTGDGCFDCGRSSHGICPRCGNPLCSAHEIDHASFRDTHGRCYYSVARDHAAVLGGRP